MGERTLALILEVSGMSRTKQVSKSKRKAVPVMGAAGLFSLAGVGAAAASTSGPVADVPLQKITPSHEIMLGEEEISDVSLATFYVIDKENARAAESGVKLAWWRGCGRCGGCGCRGCGGCGWRGCRCGGWGGCGCAGGCGCGWGWCISRGGCHAC
jgi:hypothetical protein